ncbi:LOW QUALITY PROTEIN: hypothetical protein J0S82_017096, partial [Galemys pyrenaicus]
KADINTKCKVTRWAKKIETRERKVNILDHYEVMKQGKGIGKSSRSLEASKAAVILLNEHLLLQRFHQKDGSYRQEGSSLVVSCPENCRPEGGTTKSSEGLGSAIPENTCSK